MGQVIFGIDKYAIPSGAFVARMSDNIRSVERLLDDMELKLQFPNYFGHNWDALNDCLRDLSWITEKDVVIIFEEMPQLPTSDMVIFADSMQFCTNAWHKGDGHDLIVVFPEKSQHNLQLQQSQYGAYRKFVSHHERQIRIIERYSNYSVTYTGHGRAVPASIALKAIDRLQNTEIPILGGKIVSRRWCLGRLVYATDVWGKEYEYLNWRCHDRDWQNKDEITASHRIAREKIAEATKVAHEKRKKCWVVLDVHSHIMKTVALTKEEYKYLINTLLKEHSDLRLVVSSNAHITGDSVQLFLDEDTSDDIRALTEEELDGRYFDENYEPTPEGWILEHFIDKFYVG